MSIHEAWPFQPLAAGKPEEPNSSLPAYPRLHSCLQLLRSYWWWALLLLASMLAGSAAAPRSGAQPAATAPPALLVGAPTWSYLSSAGNC